MKTLRERRGNRPKPILRFRGTGRPIPCVVEETALLLIKGLGPSADRANESGSDLVPEQTLEHAVPKEASTAALTPIQVELTPQIDAWRFLL